MNEEILRIQKMVAAGKITPEEAADLIESLGHAGDGEKPPPPPPPPPLPPAGDWDRLRTVQRSATDCVIGGVCGGLGAVTPIPSWMWRVILLFTFFTFGAGLLLYVVLWLCMPVEKKEGVLK